MSLCKSLTQIATVAIDNSYNAALLAIHFLAVKDSALAKKLQQFQEQQKIKSLKSNASLSIK